jgi:hypothetical protein
MSNNNQLQIVEIIGLDRHYAADQVLVNGRPVNGRALDVLKDIAASGAKLRAHSVVSVGHEKYFFQ